MKRKLETKRKNDKPKICISDKICFKAKTVTKDKEDHYKIIKGSSQQEDTTFVNIYAPDIPPSSRDEGLRLLHGLETSLATSLQTPQEA